MDLECTCQHCGQNVSFPANMAGDWTACPHCTQQTQLLNPKLTNCPDCSQQVSVNAAACPHCGAPLQQTATVARRLPVPSPPVLAAAPPAARKAGAANIVGNTVELGGTVYQLGTINSVRVVPGRFRPVAFTMMLLLGANLSGLLLMLALTEGGDGMGSVLWTMVLFNVLLLAPAVWRFVDGLRRCKLMLTVSSGEVVAMESTNRQLLVEVAQDIVNAISSR